MSELVGERPAPLVGWRIWRLEDRRYLCSWAMANVWSPGENVALCLSSGDRCQRPPGRRCNCGYWALNDPAGCLRLTSSRVEAGQAVLGLMRGWGEVAVHGSEGFRAQHAAVVCLFTDALFKPPLVDLRMGDLTLRWHRWLRQRVGLAGRSQKARREVAQVASSYGVPALPLTSAIEMGVLEEFGVGKGTIGNLNQKIQASLGA